MIAYRAMLDVPRELVTYVAGLLRAERRARGTRTGTRALTCWYHALMVLVWYRKREDLTLLAAGFGVSRATAYRYRDEVTAVLSATVPDLHDALRRVADSDSWVQWNALLHLGTSGTALERLADDEAAKHGSGWFHHRSLIVHHPNASAALRRGLVRQGVCRCPDWCAGRITFGRINPDL